MEPQSSRERVSKYRAGLRAAGLRPIQLWVPDTRKPGFAAECRRQSELLRADPLENEIANWLEATADTDAWQ